MYNHVRLVFWIFSILLIWSFIYSGKKISNTHSDKSYWKFAALPIVVFTLFYGLRFGRLIDYNLYAIRYYDLGKHLDDEYELLFRYVCHWGASLGIHYQFLILSITFLVIFSAFLLFKDVKYRKSLFYILLIFLSVIAPIEQLVRWYFAAAFYIFAIFYFSKSDYVKFGIFSVCACLTHIGYVPLIAIFIVLYYIRLQLIPSNVCVILLVLSTFLGETKMLEGLTPYLNILSLNDKSSQYVDSFSTLVTEGSKNIGIREVGITTQIRIILAYSFPFLLLERLKTKGVQYWLINTYCISVLIYPIFRRVEILDRYSSIFMLVSIPIIIGMSFQLFFSQFNKWNLSIKYFGILSFIANVYPILSYLFGRTEWWYMLFIWDANGRNALPLIYFN